MDGGGPRAFGDEPEPARLALLELVKELGLRFEGFGMPGTAGEILALLLASDKPLSQEEMALALGSSRSSISTNLRSLVMAGLVDRVSSPGERGDLYAAADDLLERLGQMRIDEVRDLKETARRGISALGDETKANSRLAELARWAEAVEESLRAAMRSWQSTRGEER